MPAPIEPEGRTIPSFRIASVEEQKNGRSLVKPWIRRIGKCLMIRFQFVACIIHPVLLLPNL
jgi:hypothetical protein